MRVITGGAEIFDALVYHEPHPGTMNYLSSQFDNMSAGMAGIGSGFMETARNAWERFGNSDAFRRAKAAVRMVSHMWQRDEIKSIWDMGGFQQAPLSMQRFLVANPNVRQMYNEQRVDGWSDTYVDMYPGKVGWQHYDYQLVADGMVQTPMVTFKDENGEEQQEGDFHVEFFFGEPVEGDRRLHVLEQHDLFASWDAMNTLIADGGEDPTSAYANKL